MTTAFATPTDQYDLLKAKADATLSVPGAVAWKIYARGSLGKSIFIKFGTPASYSRTNVRTIAERLLSRHPARPTLQAIRKDAPRAPWVPAGKFWGQQPAGEHFGIDDGGYPQFSHAEA